MRYLVAIGVILLAFGTACSVPETTQSVQSEKARDAAQSVRFDENAEIENIKYRLQLTSQPGLIGYIVLFNGAGQPILYTTVKGKVTSGSKRLTDPNVCLNYFVDADGTMRNHSCPSDEGTYGSSNPYIFFRDQSGRYHQWSGDYLYSDQPIRLSVEPLVINLETEAK